MNSSVLCSYDHLNKFLTKKFSWLPKPQWKLLIRISLFSSVFYFCDTSAFNVSMMLEENKSKDLKFFWCPSFNFCNKCYKFLFILLYLVSEVSLFIATTQRRNLWGFKFVTCKFMFGSGAPLLYDTCVLMIFALKFCLTVAA